MSERTDVVVVGGGVIGLACANALRDRGRSVLVLERDRIGSGASHGNCGLITPSHALPLNRPGRVREVLRMLGREDAPVFVRLRLDLGFLLWGLRFARNCKHERMLAIMAARAALLDNSRDLFVVLVGREELDCEWETHGLLEVFATGAAMEASEATHRLMEEHGIRPETFDREALLAREPALREDVHGGRLYQRDAQLRPERLVRELARVVRAKDVRVEEGCRVDGFETVGDRVRAVATRNGRFEAESVVLAAGSWSPLVARDLKVRVPVQPGKGYSITTSRPDPCPRHPILLAEANMAVTPWESGYRLGGTMELSGYDERLNRTRLDALKKGAARYLRVPLGAETVEEWCGWRPMTPDELPIIDRTPRFRNAYLATGHGMMGVSMAPATAKLVAELITGEEPFLDPKPYALGRFG